MDDASVFGVSNFRDFELGVGGGDRAGVEDLAAAGGIERGAVEHECWTRAFDDFAHFRVEVVEEGVVIVETVGHGDRFLFNHRGHKKKRNREGR